MKYGAIRRFTVGKMCKALDLTSGSYYQWLRRKETKDKKREMEQVYVNHMV
jgi:hypothetical protein